MAGLSTAYTLSLKGKKVVMIEDFELGSGQSGRTTAHFSSALDRRYYVLEKYHGTTGARLAAESHRAAIRMVEKIVRKEKIECEFETVNGYLFVDREDSPEYLDHEFESILHAGILDVFRLERAPIHSYETGPAICFHQQVQLHPLKYMKGLVDATTRNGGQIFTYTHAAEIRGGKHPQVKTDTGYTIDCSDIVVATQTPINDRYAIHTKQAPYRSYVIGLRIQKGSLERALYWDTYNPYHYVRVTKDPTDPTYEILLIGGEDHKTGQNLYPEGCYSRLEKWARKRFPHAENRVCQWSAQFEEPIDGLAYIGRNPGDQHVYIVTGHSGNGMTYSTIAGMLLTDQIMGHENPWEDIYKPSRITLRATGNYLKENANVAAQYTDWFSRDDWEDIRDLRPEEGIVIRKGMKLIAVYKNKIGNLEYRSASCPHLKGVVRWNSAENSWDCPAHGSRFDCHGKVVTGPANEDLKPIEPDQVIKIEEDRTRPLLTDGVQRLPNEDFI